MGIGGGKGDIDQANEVEIEDAIALKNLVGLCQSLIKDEQRLAKVVELVITGHRDDGKMQLPTHSIDDIINDDVELEQLVRTLVGVADAAHDGNACRPATVLPDTITFPYARHSSYSELCLLVAAFNPLDVWACTVSQRGWIPRDSMQSLFGHLCSGTAFRQDKELLQTYVEPLEWQPESALDSDATLSACTASAPGSQDPASRDVGSAIELGVRSRTVSPLPERMRDPSRKRRRGSRGLDASEPDVDR
jgi:hypothetical protein